MYNEKNCSDFKTGNFIYTIENIQRKVNRTDAIQVEFDIESGIEIYTSIDWTSDCDYELTYEKILNSPEDLSFLIGEKIYCSIIKIEGNKIIVHSKSRVMDMKIEMIKTD